MVAHKEKIHVFQHLNGMVVLNLEEITRMDIMYEKSKEEGEIWCLVIEFKENKDDRELLFGEQNKDGSWKFLSPFLLDVFHALIPTYDLSHRKFYQALKEKYPEHPFWKNAPKPKMV